MKMAESMSKVDTAWLRMDSASNLMMIVGVWTLRPRVRYDALCRRMEERLLQYPRFRQRVVEEGGHAGWAGQSARRVSRAPTACCQQVCAERNKALRRNGLCCHNGVGALPSSCQRCK